jgi:hypothetical protein
VVDIGWVTSLGSGAVAGEAGPRSMSAPRNGWIRWESGSVGLNASASFTLDYGSDGWGQVLLHELGHVMGLGHVNDPNQVMYPTTANALEYGAGDLAGLYAVGPAQGCLN